MTTGTVDEESLLKVLQDEEMDAVTYYDTELANQQSNAIDRYFARPYGDELPNRSRVVTRDVQDAVNWTIPHLMRHLTDTDDLISCDDEGLPDGHDALTDAAAFIRHVLFKDNKGSVVLHDFLWDGFVTKIGVLRTAWEPAEPCPEEILEGLTADQVQRYANDPRYRILGGAIDGEIEPDPKALHEVAEGEGQQQPMVSSPQGQMPASPQGPMGLQPPPPSGMLGMQPPLAPVAPMPELTFSLKVQKIKVGKACVEAFPPEKFRLSRRAKSIEDASYHGGEFIEFVADLIRSYPDKAYDLDPVGNHVVDKVDGIDAFSDARVTSRFPEELDTGIALQDGSPEREQAKVMIEYVRGDFDRDGVIELRRVKRCGKVILENEVVTESEFTAWSPIRVAHRAIGLSMADTLLDIQKIRTVLTRKALDSVSQSLAPRTAVNKTALGDDPTLLDRLLDHEVGDVIPVNGKPSDVFMTMTTPDVSASAAQWIEYFDRRGEEASGVNRHAMGIQPQAITDTKGGIDMLQAAANSRIEQYARWAVVAIEEALNKVVRLIIKHQDQARIVKINGRRLTIDPRRWSDEMTVSVHVGMAAESREKKLNYLAAIAGKQEAIMAQAGFSNPIVTPRHYRNTLAAMANAMGFRSAEPFFAEIPQNWQPPAPGPDPKMAEAQGKMQLMQAESQARAQIETQKLQQQSQIKTAEFQRDAELQRAKLSADHEARTAEMAHKKQLEDARLAADVQAQAQKADMERQIAEMKARHEAELAQMKISAETEIARERMDREMELARWKTAQEVRVAKFSAGQKAKFSRRRPNGFGANGEDGDGITAVRFGGSVG